MKSYSAYIFDIDGTLLNTAPRILDCIAQAVREAGLTIQPEMMTSTLIGPRISEIVEMLGYKADDPAVAKVVAAFRRFYDGDPVTHTQPYAQAIALWEQAAQNGARRFIATNKPLIPTQKVLEGFGLLPVEAVYCPDVQPGTVLSKAQMVEEIIRKHGLNAAVTLFIGDTASDYKAARANGCDFALATWGYAKNMDELRAEADLVLE